MENEKLPQNERIVLPDGYRPSENEEYMNPPQLEYFRQRLLQWREELEEESRQTLENLEREEWNQPDMMDQATLAADTAFELRTRDRYRKLMDKIDAAIARVDSCSYGYCEETGEPIGIKRLEARPIATLSLEAQEQHERFERTHSDED